MLNKERFEHHGLYPLDGHKTIKKYDLNDRNITLQYYNDQTEDISIDDLIWLYNDAIYDIGYYQEKTDKLDHELTCVERELEDLQFQLYG